MTTEQQANRPVPTLEAVAALAGVSRATVSRVVNGSPKVTPEVVETVTAAIAQLNYVPNRAARSLVTRRTQVIALVVPESTSRVFADPFFASIVQGVALYLADTDYTLNMLIASETHPDKTRRYLMSGNVDGALVVSHHSGDHSYAHLGHSLPIVFGGRPLNKSKPGSYFVDVDNVAAVESATLHRIHQGRHSIATIAGPQSARPFQPGSSRPAGIRRVAPVVRRPAAMADRRCPVVWSRPLRRLRSHPHLRTPGSRGDCPRRSSCLLAAVPCR